MCDECLCFIPWQVENYARHLACRAVSSLYYFLVGFACIFEHSCMLLKLHRLSHTRVHIRALMVFCALQAGDPPDCLVDYFPPSDWLLIVDESHISVPQIRGMYFGDRMRKETLVRHGVSPIMHQFLFVFPGRLSKGECPLEARKQQTSWPVFWSLGWYLES